MPPILAVLLLLVVVGMLLPMVPLDPSVRRIITTIVAVVALFWLISLLFGWIPLPVVLVR